MTPGASSRTVAIEMICRDTHWSLASIGRDEAVSRFPFVLEIVRLPVVIIIWTEGSPLPQVGTALATCRDGVNIKFDEASWLKEQA